ncbi:MAG TPA: hypothetical protein VLV83_25155 [Acidobacteriota bacterium]|nr:hypothetical protein [Acidobacteriota bacterium]
MCDFSLELYRSRPAQRGERYQTHRFPSGAIGLISPQDTETAICVACDTRLEVVGIPEALQDALSLGLVEEVTFVRLDGHGFRDGVEFANGQRLFLQRLGPGVAVRVIAMLDAPAWQPQLVETV